MLHVTNPAHVDALEAEPEGLEQLVRVERPWGWCENLSWVPGYKVKRIRVYRLAAQPPKTQSAR